MTAWTTLDASDLLPTDAVSAIAGLASALEQILAATQDGLDLAAGLPSLPSSSGAAAAVAEAALQTIEGLLEAGRLHMIAIPVSRTPAPPPPIPPTIDGLQASYGFSLGSTGDASAAAYADLVARSGGNAGFYAAFAESLQDLLDPCRPQYEGQSDAVVMAVLLAGAPSFAGIAASAAALETFVRPVGGASLVGRVIPVPQNLRARAVGASGKRGVGIRLDWDPPLDAYQFRRIPGVTMTVRRYAIIRSSNPSLQDARGVLDLFPSQALSEGMTNGASRVVAVGSGTNSAYLDDDADADEPSYYAIAWECVAVEGGSEQALPFDRLSNVAKATSRAPAPPRGGQSPDWHATDAAIDAIPIVASAARRLIEEARVLLAPSASPASRLRDAAKLVTTAAERASGRVSAIAADLARLAAALARPLPSMYVTLLSSASGGNAYLLAELARRLHDPTDPSRPPFDHGEYVCGVCLVAGAPRAADLAAVSGFFDSLLGPAGPGNPLLGVLETIDTLVAQAEAATFDQGVQPLLAGSPAVDPATGLPPVPTTPVIADDGTPVAADDPRNPSAGDTNVTPLSSLC